MYGTYNMEDDSSDCLIPEYRCLKHSYHTKLFGLRMCSYRVSGAAYELQLQHQPNAGALIVRIRSWAPLYLVIRIGCWLIYT